MGKVAYLLVLLFGLSLYLMVGCVNKTYNLSPATEVKLVIDTVEISRLKAENKELRRELGRRKKTKVKIVAKDMPFIVDTNWLKPRFYMVEHPDSIRINKRKTRYQDLKEKHHLEFEKSETLEPIKI